MTNDNTIDGKKSPALAGQEDLNGGLVFSGKVKDFQPNNQTICDGIFAATKRPLSTDITTHVPGFAEAINGTMSNDAGQSQFDAMADEFFNDGAAENDNASPISYSDSGEFPVWHLPQDLQRVVNVVSSAYNADPVAAWVSMLGVAMACLGKSCRGYFGNGKYLNWPTGWFVLVGMPGTNKSPIIDWFTRYLREEERSAYHRYCQELAQWKSQPKKARRGEEPKHKSLVAENITDERFFQKCCENNGKLFWLGDEFDGLLGGLGMYTKNAAPAIANLKKLYSQIDLSRDTMGHGPMLIENPAVNILASSHPGMIIDLMRKFVSRGDGFFDRFTFVEINEQKPVLEEPDITPDVVSIWYTVVERLLHNQLAEIRENEDAAKVRKQAKKNWDEQCFTICGLAKTSGDWLEARRAPLYKKAHYMVCRLAVVVARLRDEDVITADTMRYCVVLTNYFLKQQSQLLSRFGECKKPTITIKDVARWLVDNTDHKKADIARFLYPESKEPRQSLNHHLKG